MSSTSSASNNTASSPVLDIQGLVVRFPGEHGPVTVIDKVDLKIGTGEILGLVGESGCGKSMLARSIMRLIPASGKITSGRIFFEAP